MNQEKTGAFLKELRKEKELTQEQLAELMNVSDRTISRWENGKNLPDLDMLVKLADYFSIDIRELIDGEHKDFPIKEDVKTTIIKVSHYKDHNVKSLLSSILKYAWGILFCSFLTWLVYIIQPYASIPILNEISKITTTVLVIFSAYLTWSLYLIRHDLQIEPVNIKKTGAIITGFIALFGIIALIIAALE